MSRLFSRIIRSRRQLPEHLRPHDLLHHLINSPDTLGELLPEQISGILMGAMMSGHQTTCNASAWLAYNLFESKKSSSHREVR